MFVLKLFSLYIEGFLNQPPHLNCFQAVYPRRTKVRLHSSELNYHIISEGTHDPGLNICLFQLEAPCSRFVISSIHVLDQVRKLIGQSRPDDATFVYF